MQTADYGDVEFDSIEQLLTEVRTQCAVIAAAVDEYKKNGATAEALDHLAAGLGGMQCLMYLCQTYDLVSFQDVDHYEQVKLESLPHPVG